MARKKLPKEAAVRKLKAQDKVLKRLPKESEAKADFNKGEGLLRRLLRRARVKAPTKKQHDRSLR